MIRDPDTLIGATAAGTGSIGLYINIATEIASAFIVWGNALLVVGGLYLMWRRIRRDRKNDSSR